MSLTIQEMQREIDFSQISDPTAEEYLILRMVVGDIAWSGPVNILSGSATSWTDTHIAVSDSYEYRSPEVERSDQGYGRSGKRDSVDIHGQRLLGRRHLLFRGHGLWLSCLEDSAQKCTHGPCADSY